MANHDGRHNQNGRHWDGDLEMNLFVFLKGQVLFSSITVLMNLGQWHNLSIYCEDKISQYMDNVLGKKSVTYIQRQGRKQNTEGEDFA